MSETLLSQAAVAIDTAFGNEILGETPRGDGLNMARAAFGPVIAEIDRLNTVTLRSAPTEHGRMYGQGFEDGHEAALTDLRRALTEGEPTAGTVAVPHEGRCT